MLPIHYACSSGNAAAIQMILEAGGNQQLLEKASWVWASS